MNAHYDVIVIGSGISSLTSAVILAKEGKKVCLLEQGPKAGGHIGTFNKFNHNFYTGAHYTGALGNGEPFRVLLDHLGIYNSQNFCELDADGFDEFVFPDFKLALAKGYEATVQNILKIFPKEETAIKKYFDVIRDAVNCVPTYMFNEKHNADKLIKILETPLKNVVDGLTNDHKLKAVFYAYCSLHGVLPKDVSMGFHALVTDSIINSPSVININKEGVGLIDSFINRIKELNGDILNHYWKSFFLRTCNFWYPSKTNIQFNQ
ncbi:MAG: FAD-dependent oxidoreductase [Proteobacteria bacterium]|nr:FAD-dependent oxidoreductase [Pseudomonadota bacterium]